MKIQIVIEDGKVTVDVDQPDGKVKVNDKPLIAMPPGVPPVNLENRIWAKGDSYDVPTTPKSPTTLTKAAQEMARVAGRSIEEGLVKTLTQREAEDCGYCRRKGAPCARHGGEPSPTTKYYRKLEKEAQQKEDDVKYCRHCTAWTTHGTADCTEPTSKVKATKVPKEVQQPPDKFLPGHEKTQEEIESWRPQPKVPGTLNYSTAPRDGTEESRQKDARKRPINSNEAGLF